MSETKVALRPTHDPSAMPEPSRSSEAARDESPSAPTAPTQATETTRDETVLLSYSDFRVQPHHCFACGELNETGLHLKLQLATGRCHVELTLPRRFEGWEGLIHGGILCTILDEVMAWALVERDNWGVTARMSVAFRRPVLVGQAIRVEGWIVESKRRIQHTAARIVDAETGLELATADATYVAATDVRKRELKERYGLRAGASR